MSYKRKLLTIGSTVMLTTGLVTLSQLDIQIVEAREEVKGTQSISMPTAIKDNHSEVTSEEEKAPQTTPDTTEKNNSVEKENKGDITKPSTDKDGEPEKPVTPTIKTGWDGDYYYKDGEKVTSKWIYDKAYDNYFYVDATGHYKHDTWEGGYWLNTNGEVAKSQWIYDKAYKNWFKVDDNGHYKHDVWEGGYWLNANGEVAKSQWIYDKDYDNWFKVDENGHYKYHTWEGGYYLNGNGEVAKSQWIYDKAYENWFKVDENGHYLHDLWEGYYYLESNGELAQNEWIWDNNEWYYMTPKTGLMATGWTDVNGDIYYMNANGTIHHGLVYDDERAGWYYFDQKGLLKTGTIDLKDIGITVKTDKEGKISSDVDYLKKINRTIGWFKDREGKVTYSMAKRNGPDSYDCSSSLYNALWNGDFKTRITYAGTTENLYKEKGYLFKEIDARDIRRGDVFISGNEGYSLGAGGHTGIAYNDNSILHCTYKLDGIYLTPIKGYTAEHKYPVRWFRIVNQ